MIKYVLFSTALIATCVMANLAEAGEAPEKAPLSADQQQMYDDLVDSAVALYSEKHYEEAAAAFTAAFEIQLVAHRNWSRRDGLRRHFRNSGGSG